MSTAFLKSLMPVGNNAKAARAAHDYMRLKGFGGIEALGYLGSYPTWYFYFHLPVGLIELEVTYDKAVNRYSRMVTANITDDDEIARRLGG